MTITTPTPVRSHLISILNTFKWSALLLIIFVCIPTLSTANDEDILTQTLSTLTHSESPATTGGSEGEPNVIVMMGVLALGAILPYLVILLTSFLKIVIVLSLLRNALGVQQAPPNQALTGIALLMSIYVMFPTCTEMYSAGKEYISKEAPKDLLSKDAALYIYNVVNKTKEPLKKFLIRNMASSHQKNFYQLAYQSMPQDFKSDLKSDDFIVLAPAYITSQLKGAFEIGVLVYLPFFVIDLVTSNILLAMGMMMLSPLTIALPLKLLLIVMIDGWTLIITGLVKTFSH